MGKRNMLNNYIVSLIKSQQTNQTIVTSPLTVILILIVQVKYS